MDYCPPFTPMINVIQPAKSGDYEIEHFHLSAEDVRHAQMMDFGRDRYIRFLREGDYVRLKNSYDCIMSDTPMERMTSLEFVKQARGNVLIAGLGIGMILLPILAKPEVTRVHVTEKNAAVVEMVWPQILNVAGRGRSKLSIEIYPIEELSFRSYEKWDTIYFDIWPGPSADAWEESKKLHRQFRKHLAKGGWMGTWQRDCMKYMATGR